MRLDQLKPYVVPLYLITILLFLANKFVVRPYVLANEFADVWRAIVLSIPNMFEAIVGTLTAAAILTSAKAYFAPRLHRVSSFQLRVIALLFSAAYVLTQEFKLHNLGGRNTYDPNDVAASIAGLVGVGLVLLLFGISDHE